MITWYQILWKWIMNADYFKFRGINQNPRALSALLFLQRCTCKLRCRNPDQEPWVCMAKKREYRNSIETNQCPAYDRYTVIQDDWSLGLLLHPTSTAAKAAWYWDSFIANQQGSSVLRVVFSKLVLWAILIHPPGVLSHVLRHVRALALLAAFTYISPFII